MDWQTIVNAVLAALLAGGIAAVVKLGRQVAALTASLAAFDQRLADHQLVHSGLESRLTQLERLHMEQHRP